MTLRAVTPRDVPTQRRAGYHHEAIRGERSVLLSLGWISAGYPRQDYVSRRGSRLVCVTHTFRHECEAVWR